MNTCTTFQATLSLVHIRRRGFFSYDFLTRVSSSQFADEIADVIKGNKAAVGWECSRNTCRVESGWKMFKTSHGSSATALRIARKSWDIRKMPYDHRTTRAISKVCRRNTTLWSWVYHLYYEMKCIISWGWLIFKYFPQQTKPYQSNCDLVSHWKGCLLQESKIIMLYFDNRAAAIQH